MNQGDYGVNTLNQRKRLKTACEQFRISLLFFTRLLYYNQF